MLHEDSGNTSQRRKQLSRILTEELECALSLCVLLLSTDSNIVTTTFLGRILNIIFKWWECEVWGLLLKDSSILSLYYFLKNSFFYSLMQIYNKHHSKCLLVIFNWHAEHMRKRFLQGVTNWSRIREWQGCKWGPEKDCTQQGQGHRWVGPRIPTFIKCTSFPSLSSS